MLHLRLICFWGYALRINALTVATVAARFIQMLKSFSVEIEGPFRELAISKLHDLGGAEYRFGI